MQGIMINRKLFGIFTSFPHLYANVLSFYFLFSRFFFCLDYSEENENRNGESVFLPFLLGNVPFCRKLNADFQYFIGT